VFVTSSRYIPFERTLGCSVVMFWACEIMQLAAVHKLDFRLVISNRKLRHAVAQTHAFDRIYTFSPYCRRECYGTLPKLCRSTAFSWLKNVNYLLVKTSALNLGGSRMAHSEFSKICYFVCTFH
jgi:hypothetical protein